HHALDARAVVPAAVEDHDLARSRQVGHVTLQVDLGFLTLRRRGQRDHPEHARAHALGDRLDRAALPRAVAALEHDADLEALALHPLLELHQFHVEVLQSRLVVLATERLIVRHGGAGGPLAVAVRVVRELPFTALVLSHAGPPFLRTGTLGPRRCFRNGEYTLCTA